MDKDRAARLVKLIRDCGNEAVALNMPPVVIALLLKAQSLVIGTAAAEEVLKRADGHASKDLAGSIEFFKRRGT